MWEGEYAGSGLWEGLQVGNGPPSGLGLQGVTCGDGMREGLDHCIRVSAWTPGARQLLAGWMEVGVEMGRSVGIRAVALCGFEGSWDVEG